MEFAIKNRNKLHNEYINNKKSISIIAKEMGVPSSRIRRALQYLNIKLRTYAEAQKLALETGSAKHPTKGKKLDKDTITKISETRSKAWAEMSQEEKDKFKQAKKDQWEAMSVEERLELQRKAHLAIRNASVTGSKAERFVLERLEEEGYGVIVHARNLLININLEVDLFVPELRTAIEIDGPSHFLPIWGPESLARQQKSDLEKEGLLLKNGYAIIRIRQLDNTLSIKRMQVIYECILEELRKIEDSFPPEGKRFIEIEVKDGKTKRLS